MTRVEKINLAIEICHIQKDMNALEIQKFLASNKIPLDIHVIADVIRDLNYKRTSKSLRNTKANKPWYTPLQERLFPILEELARRQLRMKASPDWSARLLNEIGIRQPYYVRAPWRGKTFKRFLSRRNRYHGIKQSRTKDDKLLTYARFCDNLVDVIAQLEEYLSWEEEFLAKVDRACQTQREFQPS